MAGDDVPGERLLKYEMSAHGSEAFGDEANVIVMSAGVPVGAPPGTGRPRRQTRPGKWSWDKWRRLDQCAEHAGLSSLRGVVDAMQFAPLYCPLQGTLAPAKGDPGRGGRQTGELIIGDGGLWTVANLPIAPPTPRRGQARKDGQRPHPASHLFHRSKMTFRRGRDKPAFLKEPGVRRQETKAKSQSFPFLIPNLLITDSLLLAPCFCLLPPVSFFHNLFDSDLRKALQ